MKNFKPLRQTKMLSNLLPTDWVEKDFENETTYACEVRGQRLEDSEWDKLFNVIKKRFGEQLLECYSEESNGVHFIVYLRKVYTIETA